jgi:hypothetical protein
MRRLFFLIVSISLAVPAISQSKHPPTFEDMMKLKRVGEPEVSLDGKWVIFSVVDVDLDANTKTPHVWIVPATLVIHGQRDYKVDVPQAALHDAANARCAFQDAVFLRRSPISEQTTEFSTLVQNRQRLGGSVDHEVRCLRPPATAFSSVPTGNKSRTNWKQTIEEHP